MAFLNRVLLIGNLTRDPQVRYTPSGSAVVEFGLATNRRYVNRDGKQVDDACFIDVSMWGKRGITISEYFKKGSPIFIEGRLSFREWEDQNGNRRSKLSVVAEDFQFIGGRSSGSQQGQTQRQDSTPAGSKANAGNEEEIDVTDDEIPF